MKINYSINDRNRIVENHLWCIDAVMKKNARSIEALRMERDAVYQQLALRLIQAVNSFDPAKGTLKEHIFAQLNFELMNCRKAVRPHGITGAPKDFPAGNIIPFEVVREYALGAAA